MLVGLLPVLDRNVDAASEGIVTVGLGSGKNSSWQKNPMPNAPRIMSIAAWPRKRHPVATKSQGGAKR